MTSTIPTTLVEYQEYVRREALKIQRDMGWPDEKLNAAMKALGLPEKQDLHVPIKVTGEVFAVLDMGDEHTDIESARAAVAALTPEEVNVKLRTLGMQYSNYVVLSSEPTETPTLAVGALDMTLTNPSVSNTNRGTRMCENYDGARSGGSYCTRPVQHEGDHARGDGQRITHIWAVRP